MMNIEDMLEKEFIIENLKSRTKKEVLIELSDVFMNSITAVNRDSLIEVLLEREKLGSTGIGEGIAIPHGKLAGLEKLVISFGRSMTGVDFDSLDGNPVYIFFMILAPENSAGQHLKALAKISRMLKDVSFRESLMNIKTSEDAYNLIIEKSKTYV